MCVVFQDTTGTIRESILEVIYRIFFSYLGVSRKVSGTGLEKDAGKVRKYILPNLENDVPVHTGAQFSSSPRHPQIIDVELMCGFIVGPLAVLYLYLLCFFRGAFSGLDLWVHNDFPRSPGRGFGSPGEGC